MAALTTTTATAALKEYYNGQRLISLTYKDVPLYALLTKHKDFFGKDYPLPMRVTNPQGRSATFANAQAQKVGSNYKTFTLTRVRDYSLASIETEAMLASEDSAGAFLKLATGEIDGAIDTMRRTMGWAVYGDGSGSLGTTLSTTEDNTVATITFNNVENISKIEVGMTIELRQTGGTLRTWTGPANGNAVLVATVNRDTGVFTCTGTLGEAITAVSGTATTDIVNVVGDRNAKMSGLAAWIPSTAPSATAFFGVDRSVDATRLGGVRITSTGKPQDEAIVDAARRMGREGASPDMLFSGFSKYASLEKLLGARVRYVDIEVAGFGFRGIEVAGPKGKITVLPDRDCPETLQYMLTMDTWGLFSLKEPIMLLDQDGNKLLREGAADALEVRVGGYFQMGCDSPKDNGVLVY